MSVAEVLDGRRRWTIVRADCLEVLASLGPIQHLITDPPFGVGLGSKKGRQTRAKYASHDDDPSRFDEVLGRVRLYIGASATSAVFMAARQIPRMPPAYELGGVFVPQAGSVGPWGFQVFNAVLFYGKAPNARYGSRPTAHYSLETTEPNGHPCPKPIGWMVWLAGLASAPGAVVVDPFCGSGTTGVAALRLGRRFIGVEKEEAYCEIARTRLEAEERDSTLAAARAGQEALFR